MIIWKDIPEFEGMYQVSNTGLVKSLARDILRYGKPFKRTQDKVLAATPDMDGYPMVHLYKNRKCVAKKVHRLVAEAFIDNPGDKPQVNHINGIKDDNCVKNLEWNTQSENNLHAFRVLKRAPVITPQRLGADNPDSKSVIQCDLNGAEIKVFGGIREAQRLTGVDRSHIAKCCNDKKKTAGGFTWKFKI